MILDCTPDEFCDKIRSNCDLKASGVKTSYNVRVFGAYKEEKYFYGRLTTNTFVLRRFSQHSRNSYMIIGEYAATEDGKTKISYRFTYDKGEYWAIRLMPLIVIVLMDTFLYYKQFEVEGIMFLNVFFLLAYIYVPIDIYRGKEMLKTFKEEFNIS